MGDSGGLTLLTVGEVAQRLRVKSSWVYNHAEDLGAYRLGKYVRFRWERVLERLERDSQPGTTVGLQPKDLS